MQSRAVQLTKLSQNIDQFHLTSSSPNPIKDSSLRLPKLLAIFGWVFVLVTGQDENRERELVSTGSIICIVQIRCRTRLVLSSIISEISSIKSRSGTAYECACSAPHCCEDINPSHLFVIKGPWQPSIASTRSDT